MKSFGSYISKYLVSFVAFILILLFLNAVVFGLTFQKIVTEDYGDSSPQSMLEMTATAATPEQLSDEAVQMLRQNHIWAIYLNTDGQCYWSVDLPDNVPKNYTIQDGFDGFDGFDPFGFGFGFNGYSQQSGASYSGSDSPEMQAARNFVVNGRYAEARRVLDGMTARNARWYYLSSLANQGLGNSIDALQDARRAVQLDPNNTEYRMHLQRLQNPGRTYRTQTTYAQPGGIMRWCWSMILLNLLCNCCCGGGWGWRFRM